MNEELRKQRIKSLIEHGGYADKPGPASTSIWKWLTGMAVVAFLSHLFVDLMS